MVGALGDRDQRSDIAIVSTVDEGFLPYIGVVATSVAHHLGNGPSIDYDVFYTGPDNADTRALDGARIGSLTVRIRTASPIMQKYGTRFGFGPAALVRLALAEDMPERNRITYLDADVLVNGNILELTSFPLGDSSLAAVPDYLLIRSAYKGSRLRIGERSMSLGDYFDGTIGLKASNWIRYLNSAVMTLNLSLLRKADFLARALALLDSRNDELAWRDQDVINILLSGEATTLPAAWNVPVGTLRDRDISGLPAEVTEQLRIQQGTQWLVHFAGSLKPWRRTSLLPHSGGWWYFARQSPTRDTIEARYRQMLKERGVLPNPLLRVATTMAGWKYARAA